MTAGSRQVEVSWRIPASPARVFDAWLDADALGRWLFATPDGRMEKVAVDPRVGGRFEIVERRGNERAEHRGTYVEIDRPNRLAFDFDASFDETSTRVTVTFAPDGDGTLVTLRHEGVWPGYEDRTRKGWGMILEGLGRTLA